LQVLELAPGGQTLDERILVHVDQDVPIDTQRPCRVLVSGVLDVLARAGQDTEHCGTQRLRNAPTLKANRVLHSPGPMSLEQAAGPGKMRTEDKSHTWDVL
jgi:hypothetical protein